MTDPASQEDADAHFEAGNRFYEDSQWASAIPEYQRAYSEYSATSPVSAGVALDNTGMAYFMENQKAQALYYGGQALALQQKIGDNVRGQTTCLHLGLTYISMGEPGQAAAMGQKRLSMATQIGDKKGEAEALDFIGLSYVNSNQYDTALSFYEQSLTLQKQIGNKSGEADTLDKLGMCQAFLDRSDEALVNLHRAKALFDALGEPEHSENVLHHIWFAQNDRQLREEENQKQY